jgi:hypothetical protein
MNHADFQHYLTIATAYGRALAYDDFILKPHARDMDTELWIYDRGWVDLFERLGIFFHGTSREEMKTLATAAHDAYCTTWRTLVA